MAGITVEFTAVMVDLAKTVDKIEARMNKFAVSSESAVSRVNKTLAGLGAGLSFAGTATAVVDATRKFDGISKSMEVTSGSAEKAAQAMDFIRNTSQRLGTDLAVSAKAFSDLQAAANGTAMEGDNTRVIFSAVSQAMAALGKTSDETQGALLAIGQMMSKGTVSAEELRGQLSERLPGAFNIMARALNVSTAELSKLLEQGKVGIDVLPKFAAELDKAYSGAKLDGIEASLTRIGNAWDRLLVASGKAVKLDVVLKTVADFVGEQSTTTKLSNLGRQTQGFDPNSLIDRTLYGLKTGSILNPKGRDLGADLQEFNRLAKQERDKAQDARFSGSRLGTELDSMVSSAKQQAEEYAIVEKGIADATERLWAQNRKRIEEQERLSAQSAKASQAESARLQELFESTQRNLQKEIALRGDNSAAAEMEFEVQFSALSALNDAQKVRLLNLAAEKDFIEQNAARQSAMWQQLIADANEFVDVTKAIQDFAAGDVSQSGFNSLLGRIRDDMDAGIISAEQATEKFNELGLAFNARFIDPAKSGADDLSQYAIQAARSIQTAFADFLFDPFSEGMDGMLTAFRKILAQMASELIVSQVSQAAKGFDWAGLAQQIVGVFGGAAAGTLGSSASSAVDSFGANATGRIVASAFADGGIMTSAGTLPLNKYANGGIATTPQLALFGEGRMNEAYVPLPDGRSIPVTMKDSGPKMVNHITINVQAPNGRVEPTSLTQLRAGLERSLAKASHRNS